MNALFEGILLGLTLALVFGFGPAFFALIQTTLQQGFWAGIMLAIGIFLNDVMVVVVAMLGSVTLIPNTSDYKLLGIVGGGLLIIFGIVGLSRKFKTEGQKKDFIASPKRIMYVGKGFLLNLANPFVWLFWMSVVLSATASYKGNTYGLVTFFAAALSMIILTDTIKVFTASQLKKVVTDKFLKMINKLAGIGLVLFGIALILRAVFSF